MRVKVRNSVSTLVEATEEERDWVRKYLSFDDESKAFRRNYRTKRVERVTPPKVRLFDRQTGHFPTGVLPLIARRVIAEEGELLLEDDRTPPLRVESTADLRWLRPYQLEAVRTSISYERGILHIATGGGKTEIAIALTRVIPCNWLFVVHRAELMHQTAARWRRRFLESLGVHPSSAKALDLLDGDEVGIFGDGEATFGRYFTVATFQTLHSKGKTPECRELFKRTQGLIVDECHTLPSTTFFGVAMQFHNARYRIGLSGTPLDRDDKRSFMAVGALGPVIHRLSSAELVEAGVLARPLIRMVELEQEVDRPTYQGIYGAAVVRSGKRNKLISRIVAHHAAKPSVVFYKELSHGRQLQEALERRGLRVGLVAGSTPVSVRQNIGEDLARGDLDVVVASVVWQEGIDIPELRSLVIATAGKSIIATLQRAGRGTRRTKGKSTFELWDVFDTGNKILHRHATARRGAYEREGFEISVLSTKKLEEQGKA